MLRFLLGKTPWEALLKLLCVLLTEPDLSPKATELCKPSQPSETWLNATPAL